MKKWKKVCKRFNVIREMIDNDGDGREILRKLHEICADYCLQRWDFAEDFEDLGIEIWDVVDGIMEIDQETVNYYLNEFYDLCDNANVWLGI